MNAGKYQGFCVIVLNAFGQQKNILFPNAPNSIFTKYTFPFYARRCDCAILSNLQWFRIRAANFDFSRHFHFDTRNSMAHFIDFAKYCPVRHNLSVFHSHRFIDPTMRSALKCCKRFCIFYSHALYLTTFYGLYSHMHMDALIRWLFLGLRSEKRTSSTMCRIDCTTWFLIFHAIVARGAT